MVDSIINVSDLTKAFGDKRILNDVAFEITKGDIFGYIGRNGAGKTTTVRILLGLINKDVGRVLVFNSDPWKALRNVRKKIGVVLEDDCLFPQFSTAENLKYFLELYGINKRNIREHLKKIFNLLEIDFDTTIPVEKLSKGMRKRVAFARALAGNPELVFLDDPTANMDIESQRMIRKLISELVKEQGKTIFITSQNLIEIEKLCNKIAVIDKGNILEIGRLNHIVQKYQKKVIQIVIKNNKDVAKTRKILSSLSDVAKFNVEGRKINVALKLNAKVDINIELIKKRITVEEFKYLTDNLEDVFLKILQGGI